jgi:hypothetical protein
MSDNLEQLLDALKLTASAKSSLSDAETALKEALEEEGDNDITSQTEAVNDCKKNLEMCEKEERKLRDIVREFLNQDKKETTNEPMIKEQDVDAPDSTPARTTEPRTTTSFNFKLYKPEKFARGQNFPKFCKKFVDYVTLSRIHDDNLHILFLNMVDEFTDEKLRKVPLNSEEKRDAHKFTEIYVKKMTPSHEGRTFRSKLADLKQLSNENVEDFAFKISDTASRAFRDTAQDALLREEACFSAFLKGLSDPSLRMKLHGKAEIVTFEEALDEACRLESIKATVRAKNNDPPTGEIEVMKIHNHGKEDAGLSSNSRNKHRKGDRPNRQRNHSYQQQASANQGHQHDGSPQEQGQDRSRDEQRDNKKSRGPIICYKCQQPNHLARHCTLSLDC